MHITKRANQSLGFLHQNLSAGFQSVKEKAYLTYVRPKLEFASTVWKPYHQKDIQVIEMVHFITNTYDRYASVTIIISQLQLEVYKKKDLRLVLSWSIKSSRDQSVYGLNHTSISKHQRSLILSAADLNIIFQLALPELTI